MADRGRFFTPGEANAVLPGLAERVSGITDRVSRARTLAEAARSAAPDDRGPLLGQIGRLETEIQVLVEQIVEQGVEVKGFAPALLDFPAMHNGQEVYLCWREGEDRVDWWHPLHTGITGRRRVDPSDVGAWEWVN